MVKKIWNKHCRYLRSTKGQGMVEYVFIVAFIALALVVSLTQVGSTLATKLTEFAALIRG